MSERSGMLVRTARLPSPTCSFLRVRKIWWLAPIVLFLVTLGLILVLAEGCALAPFIDSLF